MKNMARQRKSLLRNISTIFMGLQREAIMLHLDAWKWMPRKENQKCLSSEETERGFLSTESFSVPEFLLWPEFFIKMIWITRLQRFWQRKWWRKLRFLIISDESFQRAKKIMETCSRVICCVDIFGPANEKNRHLLEIAKTSGKLV